MKTVLSTSLFAVLLSFSTVAQSKFYFRCIEKADSLYQAGEFLQSAYLYNLAFASFGGKGHVNDRYNAACSWAMGHEPDSAFKNLEKIVYKARYAAYFRLDAEAAFNSLHPNIRWKNLMDTVRTLYAVGKARTAEMANLFEPELAASLDSVRLSDQRYRKQLQETEKRYGIGSTQIKQLYTNMRQQDSINQIKVRKILDTRGWLGPEIVHGGNEALFLVIQHADLSMQLQYLPMMREAVKNKKLDPGSLAMLEDRILLRKHKQQIYGTQVRRDSVTFKFSVAPLIDPDKVDQRRAEVGLGPLADYISHWDLVWDPETYKKEMDVREK